MKKLTRYFLEGLLFIAPVTATVYVIYLIVSKVDGLFKFKVPGTGFIVTIIGITLIGFIASNFITRKALGFVDMLFGRVPFIKMIYISVRDLIGAFVGEKKGFNRPVRVELFPGSRLYALGLVTRETLSGLGLHDTVAVYLPQSFNFAGNLILVPREQVVPIEAEVSDIMAFIVSGGISVQKV